MPGKKFVLTSAISQVLLAAMSGSAHSGEGAYKCTAAPDGSGWICYEHGVQLVDEPPQLPAFPVTSDRKPERDSNLAAEPYTEAGQAQADTVTAGETSAAVLPSAATVQDPAGDTQTRAQEPVGDVSEADTITADRSSPDTSGMTDAGRTATPAQQPDDALAPPDAVHEQTDRMAYESADVDAGTGTAAGDSSLPDDAGMADLGAGGLTSPSQQPTEAPAQPERDVTRTRYGRIDENLSWDYCGRPPVDQRRERPENLFTLREESDILFEADGVDLFRGQRRASFTGDVVVTRADQRIEADDAQYDHNTEQLDLDGNVFYEEWGLRLLGESADINLAENNGQIKDVEYRIVGDNARGHALEARILSPQISSFDDITFTTCRPGNNDWIISAESLELDQTSGEGKVRNAKLELGGVPVAWLPWATFPIDDRRKSGFLVPSFGTSNSTGLDISVPYYWNIAPQADMEIVPRYMSRRGFMLGADARYLTDNYRYNFVGEYLPHDRQEGRTRGAFAFQMDGWSTPRIESHINFQYASDDDYLDDLGDSLALSSKRQLQRLGEITYHGDDWDVTGRVEHYQTLDKNIPNDQRPYSRLPQVLLTLDKPNQAYGMTYRMMAEYVYFRRDEGADGQRVDIKPGVSLPFRNSWSYIEPGVNLWLTNYNLNDTEPGYADNETRFVPTVSLDSGMFFDRKSSWFGRSSTVTLEPRLFYLYTPYVDQDDISVFDTTEYDFSFDTLFLDNRFSGPDRVGDANQVTAAVTSRILDDQTGAEVFRVSAGQIYSFIDQRVQLPGIPTNTDNASSFAAEVSALLSEHWSTTANLRWNPSNSDSNLGTVRLSYRTPEKRIFNFAYRYRKDILEQTDISARWPLSQNIHVVGRWNYSLQSNVTLDGFAGLEYDTCCWALRAVGRSFINNDGDDRSNSLYFQFELKGLTSIGNSIDSLLEDDIAGYKENN